MLFVSHSLGTVKSLCDRALLLEQGRVAIEGDVDEVIAAYLHPNLRKGGEAGPDSQGPSARPGQAAPNAPAIDLADEARRILGEISPVLPIQPAPEWRVAGMRFVNRTGGLAALYAMGEEARLEFVLAAAAGTPLPSVMVEIMDRFDRVLTGRKVVFAQASRLPFAKGEAIVVAVDVTLNLFLGEYVARISVAGEMTAAARSQPISIYNRRPFPPFFGVVGLPATFRLDGRLAAGAALLSPTN